MTKINQYVLKHWKDYKDFGQQVFDNEIQAKAFLLFLEFNKMTLEEVKETPEKINYIFGTIDPPESIKEAIELFDYFTAYKETEQTAEEFAREWYEDEKGEDYYEDFIEDALNFKSDTFIFKHEDMAFYIGLC